ncbi:unnamed protein product [Schistosoma mattheei]|uniref:Uncharacterized protein n=1 Tax=Schistosoma mattheei TaxID=31246 RepID=A0A3P8G0D8_9TREM|nr:unnamed protein product [Schistosoma mattheei]
MVEKPILKTIAASCPTNSATKSSSSLCNIKLPASCLELATPTPNFTVAFSVALVQGPVGSPNPK